MRYGKWFALVSIAASPAAMGAGAPMAKKLALQKRSEGGASMTVVPKNISTNVAAWEFEVTLDTHTVALDQDLTRASVLLDAQGNRHAPTGWEGDPPGGHRQ